MKLKVIVSLAVFLLVSITTLVALLVRRWLRKRERARVIKHLKNAKGMSVTLNPQGELLEISVILAEEHVRNPFTSFDVHGK